MVGPSSPGSPTVVLRTHTIRSRAVPRPSVLQCPRRSCCAGEAWVPPTGAPGTDRSAGSTSTITRVAKTTRREPWVTKEPSTRTSVPTGGRLASRLRTRKRSKVSAFPWRGTATRLTCPPPSSSDAGRGARATTPISHTLLTDMPAAYGQNRAMASRDDLADSASFALHLAARNEDTMRTLVR
jgi:hypothetical protein